MFNKLIKLFNKKRKSVFRVEKILKEIVSKSPKDVPVLNIILTGQFLRMERSENN